MKTHLPTTGIRPPALLRQAITIGLLVAASGVSAQDNVGDDSTVIYRSDYFLQWAPVTALDMLNRIPGMEVRGGGGGGGGGGPNNASRGGRGLGSGGGGTQILINGKRTAGKNNNTQDQLSRITADQVEYIEIIRGTSGDLDVRGSTQIANIVMGEEVASSTISYEVSADHYVDSNMEPGGTFNWSGQRGSLTYQLGATIEPRYENRQVYEQSVLGDLSANDIIEEERITDQVSNDYPSTFAFNFAHSVYVHVEESREELCSRLVWILVDQFLQSWTTSITQSPKGYYYHMFKTDFTLEKYLLSLPFHVRTRPNKQ